MWIGLSIVAVAVFIWECALKPFAHLLKLSEDLAGNPPRALHTEDHPGSLEQPDQSVPPAAQNAKPDDGTPPRTMIAGQ
ncbi:MAG TPA: hypothetical protein VMU19_01590 [Bryobacteraceae bacterium]|nr:hypothetical protein [Bryobacteraceae bacterium]